MSNRTHATPKDDPLRLELLFGRAVLTAVDVELGPWTRMSEFRGEIPGRRYPFDLGTEPERFRNTRAIATALGIDIDGARLKRSVATATRDVEGVAEVALELLEDELRLAIEPREAPTSNTARATGVIVARFALVPDVTGGADLDLVLFDQLELGTLPESGARIISRVLGAIFASPEFSPLVRAFAPRLGRDSVRIPATRLCLSEAFVRRRWKLPGAEQLRWTRLSIAPGRASLRASAIGEGDAQAYPGAVHGTHGQDALSSQEARAIAADAETALFAGDADIAIASYRQVLERFGAQPFLRARYLCALLSTGDAIHAHEASEVAARYLQRDPEDPHALAAAATLAERRGQIDEALAYTERLAESFGRAGRGDDRVDALLFAARIGARRSPADATQWVDRALRLAPRSPAVLRQRVRLARATGDADAYEDGLSRLLALARSRSTRARLHRELGRIARDARGDFEAARVHLQQAAELSDNDPAVVLEVAQTSESAGRYVDAIRAYRDAARALLPRDRHAAASAFAHAASVWETHLGDPSNAMIDAENALDADPDRWSVRLTSVRLAAAARDEVATLRAIDAAVSALDESDEAQREALAEILKIGVRFDEQRGQIESAAMKRRLLARIQQTASPSASLPPLKVEPDGTFNAFEFDTLDTNPALPQADVAAQASGLPRPTGEPNELSDTAVASPVEPFAQPFDAPHLERPATGDAGGALPPTTGEPAATLEASAAATVEGFEPAVHSAPKPESTPEQRDQARQRLRDARNSGDPAALAEALPEAAEIERDPNQRARLLSELGQLLYYELEAPSQALQYLEEAQRLDPDGAGSDYALLSALEAIYEDTASAEGLLTVYRRKLAQAVGEEIRNVYRLLMAGVLVDQLGQPVEAVALLSEILETDPRSIPALRLRAKIWHGMGRHEDAATGLEAMIAMRELDPFERQEMLRDLGRIEWQSLSRLSRAASRFEELLGEIPGDTDCISSLKQIYAKGESWDSYLDVLRRELGILAGTPNAFTDLDVAAAAALEDIPGPLQDTYGKILTEAAEVVRTRVDDPQRALVILNSAAEFAPDDMFVHEARLVCAERVQDDATFLSAAAKIIPQMLSNEDREALLVRARAAADRTGRRPELAIALAKAGVTAPKDNPSPTADSERPRQSKTSRDDPSSRLERLDGLADAGKHAEAIRAIDNWLPAARRPSLRRELLLRKGRWLLDHGADVRSAMLPLKGALILSPDSADTRLELVRASCRLGEVSQANDQLREYLDASAERELDAVEIHRFRCAIDDLTALPSGPDAAWIQTQIRTRAPLLAPQLESVSG